MVASITMRFDIDTIKCIEIEVPKLSSLALKNKDKFLFFLMQVKQFINFIRCLK
jgi:hypothetical protein